MWKPKDKKTILDIVEKAKEDLNLQSWSITNVFKKENLEGESRIKGYHFFTDAENAVTVEYEKIVIEWYPLILDLEERKMKESVYHEVIHCLTQELYELSASRYITEEQCIRANERLVQRITKICTKKIYMKKI